MAGKTRDKSKGKIQKSKLKFKPQNAININS